MNTKTEGIGGAPVPAPAPEIPTPEPAPAPLPSPAPQPPDPAAPPQPPETDEGPIPGGLEFVVPTVPPEPALDASWQAWDIYLRALQMRNDIRLRAGAISASLKHAQAQADTAAAMRDAVAAQRELIAVMNAPLPAPAPAPAPETQPLRCHCRGAPRPDCFYCRGCQGGRW